MALALANAGRLTADIRLARAVSEFEQSLPDMQKAEFRTMKSRVRATPPTVRDVMELTAEVDKGAPAPRLSEWRPRNGCGTVERQVDRWDPEWRSQ